MCNNCMTENFCFRKVQRAAAPKKSKKEKRTRKKREGEMEVRVWEERKDEKRHSLIFNLVQSFEEEKRNFWPTK